MQQYDTTVLLAAIVMHYLFSSNFLLLKYSDQELLQLLQSRDPVEECSWPIKIINLISPCNPAVHYSLLWRQKHVSTLPEIKRRKIDEDSTKFPNESKVDVGDIYGVVAARNITKGEIVAEYTGWLCTIHVISLSSIYYWHPKILNFNFFFIPSFLVLFLFIFNNLSMGHTVGDEKETQ